MLLHCLLAWIISAEKSTISGITALLCNVLFLSGTFKTFFFIFGFHIDSMSRHSFLQMYIHKLGAIIYSNISPSSFSPLLLGLQLRSCQTSWVSYKFLKLLFQKSYPFFRVVTFYLCISSSQNLVSIISILLLGLSVDFKNRRYCTSRS